MAAAQGHVLQWPDFTDGDESKWPHHMPSYTRADDAGYALTWKKKLGQVIASVLGLPNPLDYRMDGWPKGYAVFATKRADGDRQDYYLFGGKKKFRSAPEFQERAIWLYFMGQPPDGYENMLPEKAQRKPPKTKDVNTAWIAPAQKTKSPPRVQSPPKYLHGTLPSRSSLKKPGGVTKKVAFDKSPTASRISTVSPPPVIIPSPVQEKMDLVDRLLPSDEIGREESVERRGESVESRQGQPMLLTIHPAKSSSGAFPKREQINRPSRQYRIGELVWCVVDPPLRDHKSGAVIDQWPGVVATNRVQPKIITSEKVEQEPLFQINLLALNDTFVLPHSGLSPYRAYIPKASLIALLQSLPPPSISDLPKQLYYFHRHISYLPVQHRDEDMTVPDDSFLQAWGPYSVALQNAARLAMTWGFAHPIGKPPYDDESDDRLSFSALWWGSELLLAEEMASMTCDISQLAQHPAVKDVLNPEDRDEAGAVLLQIQRIEARARDDRTGGRAVIVGMLYELVPLLSNSVPDLLDSMPKQAAPFGMIWRQILPSELEVHVDVECIEGRYYDSLTGPATEFVETDPKVILALQGMAPGYNRSGSNAPSLYHDTRAEMARFAEEKALEDLADYWAEKEQSEMELEQE